jgi:hypothetical protein
LLTLEGWTSAHIGAAFSVREDVARDWRSTFMREGVEGLASRTEPGRPPVKAQAALAVADELLAAPVAGSSEIEERLQRCGRGDAFASYEASGLAIDGVRPLGRRI